jgi:hypothetical protein
VDCGRRKGMAPIDWWDTVLHGAPWLILLFFLGKDFLLKIWQKDS